MNDPRNNDAVLTRQTKMVCTIGPACRSPFMLEELIRAGMDVARLHFSYGQQSQHAETIGHIRELSKALGRPVAVLQDLSGSKARMVGFGQERVRLEAGGKFTLKAHKIEGDNTAVSISVPELVSVAETGDTLLLAGGELELQATTVTDSEIRCVVIRGGNVKSQQGVHILKKPAPVGVPTEKDLDDVAFGIAHGVDWIALSYASTGQEVHKLREFIRKRSADTPIVAKIERAEALQDLGNIIRLADAVMVARGDLGLEISIEDIARLQKDIIRRANAAGKPVIVATEMLASMIEQPHPTRAEVTDIANAILDGADAVMLSGETAIGKHPIEAAHTMQRIALKTDAKLSPTGNNHRHAADFKEEIGVAVARGACETAHALKANLIFCCTQTDRMARLISQERPGIPIVGVGGSQEILRRMVLFRGVHPLLAAAGARSSESDFAAARRAVLETKLARASDRAVVVERVAEELPETVNYSIRPAVL